MGKKFNKKLSFPKIKSHETQTSSKREIKVDAKKTGYIVTGFTTTCFYYYWSFYV